MLVSKFKSHSIRAILPDPRRALFDQARYQLLTHKHGRSTWAHCGGGLHRMYMCATGPSVCTVAHQREKSKAVSSLRASSWCNKCAQTGQS